MRPNWKAVRQAFHAELTRVFVPFMLGQGFSPPEMGGIRTDAFGSRFDMPMVRIREGRLDLLTLSMLPQMPGSLYTFAQCVATPEGLRLDDLVGVDGMAFMRPPLLRTCFVTSRPVRTSWLRRKASRPYMVEDATVTGEALQNAVSIEVARFIADMQDLEARAWEALHRNGIWRIGLKDESIFADELIPADNPEFLRLMRRKHQD